MDGEMQEAIGINYDELLNETVHLAKIANDSTIPAFEDATSIAASVLCVVTFLLSGKVLWNLHYAFHFGNLYTVLFSHVLTGCFHAILYAGVSLVPRRMIQHVWLYVTVVEYEAAIQEALSFVSTSFYMLAISWCGNERVAEIAGSGLGTKIAISVAWFIPAYIVNVLLNICRLRYIQYEMGEGNAGCIMYFCWSCYGVTLAAFFGTWIQERLFGYSSRKRGYHGITRRQYARVVIGIALVVAVRGATMSVQNRHVRIPRALSLLLYPTITFCTVPMMNFLRATNPALRVETLNNAV